MELGMPCPFQILNTRTRLGPKKLRMFYGYFNYIPEPTQIREKPTRIDPKFFKYLLGLNI